MLVFSYVSACEQLYPISTVLTASGIADANLAQAAIQDVGAVSRRVHPAVYHGRRRRLTSRDIFRRRTVRNAIFTQYGKPAAPIRPFMGEMCNDFLCSFRSRCIQPGIHRQSRQAAFRPLDVHQPDHFGHIIRRSRGISRSQYTIHIAPLHRAPAQQAQQQHPGKQRRQPALPASSLHVRPCLSFHLVCPADRPPQL